MANSVYCIAKSEAQAVRIANRLEAAGFGADDVSVLYPDPRGVRDLGHQNSTKAPEGTAIGAGTGAALGGAVGWLAGIGLLAIPGVGPLIAAGPIIATLSGLAVGGSVGGLTGALVGTGIPEYEAQQYAGKLKGGNVLISVHTHDSDDAARVRKIMTDEQAEDISTGAEASVPRA
ncbi:MAG TPA: hypothetical protein VL096_12560 [Pirellulaceae bacterium]|nr:hypothetical protein [Pirellulaceae bacterium]